MAACAVCSGAITKSDAFVLHGTEVVHRACVKGLAATRGTKLEALVIRLRAKVRDLELLAKSVELDREDSEARIREQITELQRLLRDLVGQNAKLEKLVEQWRADAKSQTARAERAEAAAATLDQRVARERDQAIAERDQARRERDQARNEAALHQTIQGRPPVKTVESNARDPDPPTAADEDSAERFRLLELDIPE